MLTKTSSDIANVISVGGNSVVSWGLWGAPVMRGLRSGLRMMSELRKKGEKQAPLQKSEGRGPGRSPEREGARCSGDGRGHFVCPEQGRAPLRGTCGPEGGLEGGRRGVRWQVWHSEPAFKSTLGGCVAAAS